METGTYVRGDLAILEAGFAALDQAVLVHDKEGRIVACNPAAAKLANRPVDEILGRSARDYEEDVRYKDGTKITAENSRLQRCIRTGKPERNVLVEIRNDGRGGPPRWISVSYQPLMHEGESEAWGAVSSIVPVPSPEEPREALTGFSPQLQSMLGDGPALLYLKDLEGRYLFMNPPFGRVLGVRRDEAAGKLDHDLLPPDVADARAESDRRALESRTAVEVEERFGERIVRTTKFPLLDGSGEPYAIAGVAADVTELHAQLERAPAALLALDEETRVSYANHAARAIAQQCDDLQLAIDNGERIAELAGREVEPGVTFTRSFECPDGGEIWLIIEVTKLESGRGMCSIRDVTEERDRLQELSHYAFHDALTGLPNRRFIEEQLALGLARARRQIGGLGVVFVDVDGLKAVNDELGHGPGDEVLVEVAERLQRAVRETDSIGRMGDPEAIVARRGGDEFLVVLGDMPAECADQIAEIMERIDAALREPFHVGEQELDISASMGAAAYPYDSQDPATLLELANAGMRAAKRRR